MRRKINKIDLDWLEFDNFAKEMFNKLKEKLFK